ncbi:hypothetical protein [Catenuloplanes japonicus]|uniref:hypothetical protein n=1 Tax=Catenuloplanes japonicus TaxID=33876 RepID=UPI0005279FAA|nr:hypothetical protein [Catenuloplanes japonicus]
MTAVCMSWLTVDFFARHGWQLATAPDGTRTATRPENPGLVLPVPAPCGHADCPTTHTAPVSVNVPDDLGGMPW